MIMNKPMIGLREALGLSLGVRPKMLVIATLMNCLLMASSVSQAQPEVRKVSYKGDFSSNFLNPERGLIDTIYPEWTTPPTPTRALTDADCLKARKAGRSLIAVRYCIYDF